MHSWSSAESRHYLERMSLLDQIRSGQIRLQVEMIDVFLEARDVLSQLPDNYRAEHNYGVSLGGGLGKVAGKVFRIGHLGWLNETMVLRALGGVEMAMRDAGIPFQAGSGVGAAVEYYTDSRQPLSLAAE